MAPPARCRHVDMDMSTVAHTRVELSSPSSVPGWWLESDRLWTLYLDTSGMQVVWDRARRIQTHICTQVHTHKHTRASTEQCNILKKDGWWPEIRVSGNRRTQDAERTQRLEHGRVQVIQFKFVVGGLKKRFTWWGLGRQCRPTQE